MVDRHWHLEGCRPHEIVRGSINQSVTSSANSFNTESVADGLDGLSLWQEQHGTGRCAARGQSGAPQHELTSASASYVLYYGIILPAFTPFVAHEPSPDAPRSLSSPSL